MMADIDENGVLSIIPQTPIEFYALKHWNENFQKGNEKSVFKLDMDEDRLPKNMPGRIRP